MDNVVLSINILMPMILLVVLGNLLKIKGVIDKNYINISSVLVYNLALPLTLFMNTSRLNLNSEITHDTWALMLIGSVVIISLFAISYLISFFISKDKRVRGAFIQGSCRSNYAIIGYPILLNLFGDKVILPMTFFTLFLITITNTLTIILLTINNEQRKGLNIRDLIIKVFTNPLIDSLLIGFLFSIFKIRIPIFLNNTFIQITAITTPLALISIGAMFVIDLNSKKISLPLFSSVMLKTIVFPFIFTSIAVVIGLRDVSLGIIFIALASPTPPSSFIIAKIMNSDDVLAANIVVLSTLFSTISIFIGITLLKGLNYI